MNAPFVEGILAREKTFERLYIRPPQFWTDKGVTMALGREVTSVDAAAKALTLSDGTQWTYDSLVWATGGNLGRLSCPGAQLAGVHAIGNRADCDQLMGEIDGGVKRICVIGGGYIGLEAVTVLTTMGCHVTLLEMAPRVLARVAGPELSAFYENEHRIHGVDLRTGVVVDSLLSNGRVTGVQLAHGSIIDCDAVIVGIGIVPAIASLVAAGTLEAGGIKVDEFCRASLPYVYAIGDCAALLAILPMVW